MSIKYKLRRKIWKWFGPKLPKQSMTFSELIPVFEKWNNARNIFIFPDLYLR